MLGAVNVRPPEIAHQEMLTAEHVERQEAIVIVIAVEETPHLTAVHGIVGRVEVEHQLLWRPIERGDEALHHRDMGRPRPGAVRRPVEAADGRRAGQPPIAPDRRLQRQIVA